MKTTVIIDDKLLSQAMEAAGTKTKRETIEIGLRELVRRRNMAALRQELGTFDLELSIEDLEVLRSE